MHIAIVIMILTKMAKEEFVNLLDDSLLDAGKHQQLENRVVDAKILLG
jgi:hypothetical protein